MLITRRDPSYSRKRTKDTIEFCRGRIPIKAKVLNIGEKNPLSEEMAKELMHKVIYTDSDLDYEITPDGKYGYVTCFEVIEHLLNPRTFFDNLYLVTTSNPTVLLSYPSRPKWMWNNEEHFHEYDRLRFEYLLKKTGWRIVEEKPIYVKRWPTGIRPIIRNFIPQTTIYQLEKI